MILLINIGIYYYKIINPIKNNEEIAKRYEEEQTPEYQEQKMNEVLEQAEKEATQIFKNQSEKTRMKEYIVRYHQLLLEKNYEKAYDLLYPAFKENYFRTLEEYKEYCERTYPDFSCIEYGDFQREGTIYIWDICIKDVLDTEDEGIVQKFVIKENDFEDFQLSFQVIER